VYLRVLRYPSRQCANYQGELTTEVAEGSAYSVPSGSAMPVEMMDVFARTRRGR
jgi:hypothetical protein